MMSTSLNTQLVQVAAPITTSSMVVIVMLISFLPS